MNFKYFRECRFLLFAGTRALIRLERTMNLLEGGKGGEGRMGGGERVGRGRREGGKRRWGGDVGGERECEGERGRVGREVGEGTGGEGREGRGGMTVIHIVIGMFTSNPILDTTIFK